MQTATHTRRHARPFTCTRAITLILLGLTIGSTAAGQMSPKDAARLLELEREIADTEEAALAKDTAYTELTAAVTEASEAVSAHRAAHQARLDADPEYAALIEKRNTALARIRDIETRQSEVTRTLRSNLATIKAARSELSKRQRQHTQALRNRDRHQRRHDQLLASWQDGDEEDDAGTNRSGGRHNSLAALREKINQFNGEAADLDAQIAAIQSKLNETEPIADEASQSLRAINAELSEAKRALDDAEKAHADATAQWQQRYEADPKTIELEDKLRHETNRQQTARQAVLAKLQRTNKTYAALIAERDRIQPRD